MIVDLADVPEYVPLLAGWFRAEWSDYYRDRSPEDVEESFRMRLNADRIPLALVALEEGRPVGTVSLTEVSVPTHMHLRPWIAGLYVIPEMRHRGVGLELVAAAGKRAEMLGVERLYIAISAAVERYREAGWSVVDRADVGGEEVTVLSRDLRSAATGAATGTRHSSVD